ncbi:RPII140-upstream gene protein [Coccinella septempunctata]|uniref:RPII140-upstream gene protein n=1 Tax=Coccinella septempunctata TaxID=41139 RepID=UPI001D091F57|nr:RPII140-upstream gene protein [Coccinella septempunctata]
MFKYLKNINFHGMMFGAFFPFSSTNDFDKVDIGLDTLKENSSDGWTRLRKMFQIDEFGEVSDEVTIIGQTAMISSFVGLVYGGVMNSSTAYTDFLRQNTASTFTSHFEAKRKLQDAVTKSFAKGAWKWGWRICFFSTSFVGLSTTISVYRGESGICEYALGGAITGALYKWQMGPRGWIVGGALGGILGLFSGSLSYGLLKLSGKSMSELRKYQAGIGDYRRDLIREGMKRKEEDEDHLLLMVKPSGGTEK